MIWIYVIAVNVAAFLAGMYLSRMRRTAILRRLLTIAGGSLGMLLSCLLGDLRGGRHRMTHEEKREDNQRYLVFMQSFAWLIVHFTLFLVFRGSGSKEALWRLRNLYMQYDWLVITLAVVNGVTFLLYALDKLLAVFSARRIPEKWLLLMTVPGGAFAALLAMELTDHKTTHPQFTRGVPMMLIAQLFLLLCLAEGLL